MPAHTRAAQVDLDATPYYHCISRCVRRAFLCGDDPYTGESYEHRKDWLVERLHTLGDIFAVDICAYAVMSNHFHLVLHVDRERALAWTDEEVAERWARLFKGAAAKLGVLNDEARSRQLSRWRERLSDLSWMMRSLNEPIARRANKEDECTGRFWEGRFKSQPLMDEAALLTCMAYVDLNPVRAAMCEHLDEAHFTSIAQRLREAAEHADSSPAGLLPFAGQAGDAEGPRVPMRFADYVDLLEWTGRSVREGKATLSGRKPAAVLRMSIEPDRWVETMSHQGLRTLGALGTPEALDALAARQGKRWVKGQRWARGLFGLAA